LSVSFVNKPPALEPAGELQLHDIETKPWSDGCKQENGQTHVYTQVSVTVIAHINSVLFSVEHIASKRKKKTIY
jgi:hypothetical protein